MIFQWPLMLWALLAVPALIALYVFILRRKKQAALRYASLGLVREALTDAAIAERIELALAALAALLPKPVSKKRKRNA